MKTIKFTTDPYWSPDCEAAAATIPRGWNGQTDWLRKHSDRYWDDICCAYGARGEGHGEWFNAREAAKAIDPKGYMPKTHEQYTRATLNLALAMVDPDLPCIERVGNRWRFLNPGPASPPAGENVIRFPKDDNGVDA